MKLKPSEIKLNPDNPRIIKDEKYQKLVQSLKDFPEMADVREVVVNKDHIILGGNMRFKAMKEAGWTEIPVKVVDWDEAKQKEFIIKDNASFGEWDWDIVANQYELEDLAAWGVDLPEALLPQEEVEEDEAPEVSSEPPVSQLGSIYQLGRHRVMCGDSTDKANVELLMEGVKADMVFTDPPYGIGFKYESYDDTEDNWYELINKVLPILRSLSSFVVMPACRIVALEWWYKNHKPDWIMCWYKGSPGHRSKVGFNDWEPHLVWGKPKNQIHDYWQTHSGFDVDDHSCPKPIDYSAWIVQRAVDKNDIVLDVFLGSGSTLIACEQTDRTCYGMELDPKYVDVIRKRYAKFVNNNELPENWQELTLAIAGEKHDGK